MTPVVKVDIRQILKLEHVNAQAAVNAFTSILYTKLNALALPIAQALTPKRTGRFRRAHIVTVEALGVVSMGIDLTIAPYAPAVHYRRRSKYGGKLVIDVLQTDGRLRNAIDRAVDEAADALAKLLVQVR